MSAKMDSNDDESDYQCGNFDDMGLKKDILRGIYAYGFERPSLIQQRAIIPFIRGRDIIAQAQSGTGKTGTFSISVLQTVDADANETQALILSPTRELAKQTYNVIRHIGEFSGISFREMIGGMRLLERRHTDLDALAPNKVGHQRQEESGGGGSTPQVIIGTPGKVLDELIQKRINFRKLRICVLDEADEILSKGFYEQMYKIFGYIPKTTQVGLFSATLPDEILHLTHEIMNNPYKILVRKDELTLEGIRQYYLSLESKMHKLNALLDLYGTISISQSIIYCNSRKKVDYLVAKLRENSFTVSYLYGDMQQQERNTVMNSFRTGETRVLVTTDILARGIDVQQVSLVVNYDIPLQIETYIHRVGRSGRYGRKGMSITFAVGKKEMDDVRYIERFFHTELLPFSEAN